MTAAADWDGTPPGNVSEWKAETPVLLLKSNHGTRTETAGYFEETQTRFRIVIKAASHRVFTDQIRFPFLA